MTLLGLVFYILIAMISIMSIYRICQGKCYLFKKWREDGPGTKGYEEAKDILTHIWLGFASIIVLFVIIISMNSIKIF